MPSAPDDIPLDSPTELPHTLSATEHEQLLAAGRLARWAGISLLSFILLLLSSYVFVALREGIYLLQPFNTFSLSDWIDFILLTIALGSLALAAWYCLALSRLTAVIPPATESSDLTPSLRSLQTIFTYLGATVMVLLAKWILSFLF